MAGNLRNVENGTKQIKKICVHLSHLYVIFYVFLHPLSKVKKYSYLCKLFFSKTRTIMISQKLLKPKSIVVVGASNDVQKPGGKVLKNLLSSDFKGEIYAVNPKEEEVQGITCFAAVEDLPQVDCAILAIAAAYCPSAVDVLATQKQTGGYIILSAGFSEENEEGARLEKAIVDRINSVQGSLIGPNCTGFLNTNYCGAFDAPIPELNSKGADFITGSGATAVFIKEYGVVNGLAFNSVWAVGNSAQTGIEEVLEYLDETFNPQTSSTVKMLYMENVRNPEKLLKHASSLINKGCKIAAIKSGCSDAGSRAASSHTGALATSDVAVDALFRKAGIVRCYNREELVSVTSVFMHPQPKGRNIAIITHAGGPAVMLTDTLSNNGLNVPHIEGEAAEKLLSKLYPGSSVSNPIDFLATGTAEQLDTILTYIDKYFDFIDGTAVIYGTAGIFPSDAIYETVFNHSKTDSKPIFHIIPSPYLTEQEMKNIFAKGHLCFTDEVAFGKALGKVYHFKQDNIAKQIDNSDKINIDANKIRSIIDNAENGYLAPDKVQSLFDLAGIPRAKEIVVDSKEKLIDAIKQIGFPLVMKVVGPVHKSDVGGVKLNIESEITATETFENMMRIKDATGVLLLNTSSYTEESDPEHGVAFTSVSFSNGFAARSYNDASTTW